MKKYKFDNDGYYVKNGVSFFDLLVLVFIVLKLTNVISWPWIWVLSPIWIPFIVAIILIVILLIFDRW